MKLNLEKIRHIVNYKILFKFRVYIKRKITSILKIDRPTSYPYITGDGFRGFAQHFFDDISNMNPTAVLNGDIVFARIDMLHSFFKKIDPQIRNEYILISHNADYTISEKEFGKYNKDKIIRWFSQNVKYTNHKITPVPIGITNHRYLDEIHALEKTLASTSQIIEKKNKMLILFRGTNPIRTEVRNVLSGLKTVDVAGETAKQDYFKKISEYKFIISPEGNGPDCHRTWESMYLKSVPIVIRNTYTEYFEKIGLPIMLINEWKDLKNIDELFLKQKYEELKDRFNSPALHLDYWQKEINKLKPKN